MRNNPFILNGTIPDDLFCDRKQETSALIQCIKNEENVVLISSRRMGKTQLINHVFSRPEIAEDYITISVDILHTTSLRELVFELGHAVFKNVAASKRLVKKLALTLKSLSLSFGYDPLQGTPTFDLKLGDISNPAFSLEEIFSFLEQASRRCVVAIDEFQQITEYQEKNIEALLRSHMQRCGNVSFIFSGSEQHLLTKMFQLSSRPFYNSATIMHLDSLDKKIYAEFATRLFNNSSRQITREAVSMVYDTFEGVTFYLQQLMHNAFSETENGGCCDEAMAAGLIHNYVERYGTLGRELLSTVSESQKNLLYAIASEGQASGIMSAAFIKRHRLLSASAVQASLRALMRRGILSQREGCYRLGDPLLRLWIGDYILR